MNGSGIADWANFFVAEVGASAALSGLLFVAVSINLQTILKYPHLPGRAAETLFVVVGALIASSTALVPGLPLPLTGVAIAATGVAMCFFPAVIQWRAFRQGDDATMTRPASRIALSLVPGCPIIIGGMMMVLSLPAGLYWIAFGIVAALVAGIVNAWVLLVEIVR
jgi:modulator of FtsH protease